MWSNTVERDKETETQRQRDRHSDEVTLSSSLSSPLIQSVYSDLLTTGFGPEQIEEMKVESREKIES